MMHHKGMFTQRVLCALLVRFVRAKRGLLRADNVWKNAWNNALIEYNGKNAEKDMTKDAV